MGVRARGEAQSQKKTLIASEQDRPDVARRRAQWLRYRHRIDPSRLVFIDETWTKTNMAPLRGWAPRGERLKAKVPHRRWKTMTFLAALRLDRVEAPWLIDGPINGERFRLYVEKVLLPTLRPDDIVVIDNLGSHRGRQSAGSSARSAPSCSPDRWACDHTRSVSTAERNQPGREQRALAVTCPVLHEPPPLFHQIAPHVGRFRLIVYGVRQRQLGDLARVSGRLGAQSRNEPRKCERTRRGDSSR